MVNTPPSRPLAILGGGDHLLGFVFRLHQPPKVGIAQQEAPVDDGQGGVHCHDADDQRMQHGRWNVCRPSPSCVDGKLAVCSHSSLPASLVSQWTSHPSTLSLPTGH